MTSNNDSGAKPSKHKGSEPKEPSETGSTEYAEFLKAISDDNSVSLVLQAHLFIESRLNSLLLFALERPSVLETARLSFRQKVQILEATGLISEKLPPMLNALNQVRNSFSHVPQYQITRKDMDKLLAVVPSDFRSKILRGKKMAVRNGALKEIITFIAGYTAGHCDIEADSPRLVVGRKEI